MNLEKLPDIELLEIVYDDRADSKAKNEARDTLFERAIENIRKSDKMKKSYAEEFLSLYYTPVIKKWIKKCVNISSIKMEIHRDKKEDWSQDVLIYFFKAVKEGRFKWKKGLPHAANALSKYIKSISYFTVYNDNVNMRFFKREVQRSYRIVIEKKGLSKDEVNILKSYLNNLKDESKMILEIAIHGGGAKDICKALDIHPRDNQKAWNLKETAYWRLYKSIKRHQSSHQDKSVSKLHQMLLSEMRKDRLLKTNYSLFEADKQSFREYLSDRFKQER